MRRISRRSSLGGVLAFSVLLLVYAALAGSAAANHDRPQAATPKHDSLVLAYNDCVTPNVAHDTTAPKAPSCTGSSLKGLLTVGTPDFNSLPAQFGGSVRLTVCPTTGCSGSDVKVAVMMTDVRCGKALAQANPGVCTGGAAFASYLGTVGVDIDMKITDHCNTPVFQETCPPVPGTTATSQHAAFQIVTPCGSVGATIGSSCPLLTTLNAQAPGAVQGGYRSNIESTTSVSDGGLDGDAATAPDNSLFLTEGIFIP